MSFNEDNGLSKQELISKLEKISQLHQKLLSIKNQINNYEPEDNYEREVEVPDFPGKHIDDARCERLEETIDHTSKNAVVMMGSAFDKLFTPQKPNKPQPKGFKEKQYSRDEKTGCFTKIAAAISAFFFLAIPFNYKDSPEAIPVIVIIAVIAAAVFALLNLKTKAEKDKVKRENEKARAKYTAYRDDLDNKYKKQLSEYEDALAAHNFAREDFLTKYKNWRSAYLKSCEEEEESEERLEEDRLEAVKKMEEELLAPVCQELKEANDLIADNYLYAIDTIIDLIKSGRADGIKEAINLYEEIEYRERQLDLQREQEEQRRYEEKQRAKEEQRRHEEEMQQRENFERQRRYDEEQRHKEEMRQRENFERQRRYDEEQREKEAQRREDQRAREAQRREDDRRISQERDQRSSTQRRCQACANVAHCSISFSAAANNCAGYRPR